MTATQKDAIAQRLANIAKAITETQADNAAELLRLAALATWQLQRLTRIPVSSNLQPKSK